MPPRASSTPKRHPRQRPRTRRYRPTQHTERRRRGLTTSPTAPANATCATSTRDTSTTTSRRDARKARSKLGWEPTVTFEKLVRLRVDADLERIRATQDEVRAGA